MPRQIFPRQPAVCRTRPRGPGRTPGLTLVAGLEYGPIAAFQVRADSALPLVISQVIDVIRFTCGFTFQWFAPVDAGEAEQITYLSGTVHRPGEVHESNTVTEHGHAARN